MKKQRGFTIIELLIATAVFGAILILCMGAFIQMGRMYYKGVTTAKTQEATRSIMDELTRSIQFSKDKITEGAISSSGASYCIGLARYSFITGKQLVDSGSPSANQTKHALWRDSSMTHNPCEAETPADNEFLTTTSNVAKYTELLSEGMRINEIKLTPIEATKPFVPASGSNPDKTSASQVWEVSVSISYGDDDLFVKNGGTIDYRQCEGSSVIGTQFCAVSELKSVVTRRLQ